MTSTAFGQRADWLNLPLFPAAAYDVVVIAASTGGIHALSTILADIPAEFPAALVIVQHRSRTAESWLCDVLLRHSRLPVREVEDGDQLMAGWVYIAPVDHHVTIGPNRRLRLSGTDAPLVHFTRPAADPLFESAAAMIGERTIGVILTGMLDDGTAGARKIYDAGGIVIAQDPASSEVTSMPRSAIRAGCVDYILPLDQIAEAVTTLVTSSPTVPS